MQTATSKIVKDYHSPRETVAWFENKLGDAYFALGELGKAEEQQQAAIAVYPSCYKALASLTRIYASKHDWTGVIKWGQSCEKITQVIDVEALLGDAYGALGNEKESKEHYSAVAYLAGRPLAASDSLHEYAASPGSHGHTLDRQYAIFCADHGTDLDSAYAYALRDFEARPDLFAFDTLAWVCYKRGDTAEASKAIDLALRRGTKDPRLLYHAAIIKASAHEAKKAQQYLQEASALNLALDPPEQAGLQELELQAKNNKSDLGSGTSSGRK
jgi:tetratricopeptide (TPR) repeat protein